MTSGDNGECCEQSNPRESGCSHVKSSYLETNWRYRLDFLKFDIEMFYLNTVEQLFLFVEQLDHLEVCLPHTRLLTCNWNTITGSIPKLKVEFK